MQALNEMVSNSGAPIELVDGFIESISVLVPWKALLNDSCEIEIHGLQLTFAVKQKSEGLYYYLGETKPYVLHGN